MAAYLATREALAIFNGADCDASIVLTRGGHCAARHLGVPLRNQIYQLSPNKTNQRNIHHHRRDSFELKNGNNRCDMEDLSHASARAMVPVLHNRYVYFQLSILAASEEALPADDHDGHLFRTKMAFTDASEEECCDDNRERGAGTAGAIKDIISIGLSTQQMTLSSPLGGGKAGLGEEVAEQNLLGKERSSRSIGLRSIDGRLILDEVSVELSATNIVDKRRMQKLHSEAKSYGKYVSSPIFGVGSTIGVLVYRGDSGGPGGCDENKREAEPTDFTSRSSLLSSSAPLPASASTPTVTSNVHGSKEASVWLSFTVDGRAVKLQSEDAGIALSVNWPRHSFDQCGEEGASVAHAAGAAAAPSAFFMTVPQGEELFPTITISSWNSIGFVAAASPGVARRDSRSAPCSAPPLFSRKVLGRFCAADIIEPSRALIGAPEGCAVYALDGSLVLSEVD